jgi:hypothetical protein
LIVYLAEPLGEFAVEDFAYLACGYIDDEDMVFHVLPSSVYHEPACEADLDLDTLWEMMMINYRNR